jgi:2-hydroxy-3-keto-5-methylthiopentenyl-1-phosphate phosphatase
MKAHPQCSAVLVSDFDGTMTRKDFYQLVRERMLPRDTPDFWQEYRAGRMTHFEALQAIFASIRVDESQLLDLLKEMELDPRLPQAVSALREAGWEVVVTSAGCEWYINRLLGEHEISLSVFANPGRFIPGKGLLMSLPVEGKYLSKTLGVDKAALVREALADYQHVAFAGDGYPDIDAAELVPAHLRFARGALAEVAAARGLEFIHFERWSEIAECLRRISMK